MKIAYKFARSGKVFKELSEEDATLIPHLIKVGEILPTDDYWMPGMQTWNKVSLRNWDSPAAAEPATPKPEPTPQPAPQAKKPAAAAPAQNQTRRAALHECMSCKKTFNEPGKAVSGYSVIGKAVKFFLFSVAVQIVIGVIGGIYTATANPFDRSVIGLIIVCLIVFALAILALGLFLMAVFELISASVTHGLYRANPERCPNCTSTTFSR